ncbi:MAG: hypothetical protein H6836_10425 [Planctomycetes bacterium]|nr:hypothetical protein [Planctomycetota bacterium]MCB9889977.1 hypothetical protein [Planctomycetota bacterium]
MTNTRLTRPISATEELHLIEQLQQQLGDQDPNSDADPRLAMFDGDGEYPEEELEPEQSASEVLRASRPARPSRRRRRTDHNSGGMLMVFTGGLLILGAVALTLSALAMPAALRQGLHNLNTLGLTPGLLLTLGILLSLVAKIRQHQLAQQVRFTDLEDALYENNAYCVSSLEYLVNGQEQLLAGRTAGETDPVLHALEVQGERINSVTKALRMYGKPLAEINHLVGKVTGQAAVSMERIDALATELDKLGSLTSTRIEALLEKVDSFGESTWTEVKSISEQVNGVRAQTAKIRESHEGLMPLIQDLAEGAPARRAAEATPKASSTPKRAASASKAQASTPAPAPAADAKDEGDTSAPGSLAQSIAGSQKIQGKGVMGAIAKLKGMRNN